MIYKQINNISKKEIKKKLTKFFNEDDIKNDITTNTFVDKKKTMKVSFIAEFEGVFCGEKIIESAFSKDGKTSVLSKQIKALGWNSALVIAGADVDINFTRAISNIREIDVLPQSGANVYDILRRDTLVLTKDAVEQLQERLK